MASSQSDDPELRAAAASAREVLARFRADDEQYARGSGPRVDYTSAAYELAAHLHHLLSLLGGNDDARDDDV